MKLSLLIALTVICKLALIKPIELACSDALINSWTKSSGTASSGSASGIISNVQTIAYDSSYVYIRSSGIPSYSIGTWTANPNSAANKNYYFKISRSSSLGTATVPSTKTSTGMGAIGYLINGVPLYNMQDGYSYKTSTATCTTSGDGIWQRNAYAYEGISFDSCNGHPDSSSAYHNHIDPNCLYTKSSTSHSPILGWMLDGYPIYGPYGYSTGTTTVKFMTTGYAKRTDMGGVRQTLLSSSGVTTTLTSSQYGPTIDSATLTYPWSGSTYPLGAFIQDYVWSSGSDLDVYNGRANSVTPEYPNGIYAYYIPLVSSSSLTPTVPFLIGPSYYGTPITTTITSIPSTATTYFNYYTSINSTTCEANSNFKTFGLFQIIFCIPISIVLIQ